MALQVNITHNWSDGHRKHVLADVVASDNYAAGGDTLDLTEAGSQNAPLHVEVHGGCSAYKYDFVHGDGPGDGLLSVFDLGTGAEVPAGAYPAGVTGDAIKLHAIFDNMQ